MGKEEGRDEQEKEEGEEPICTNILPRKKEERKGFPCKKRFPAKIYHYPYPLIHPFRIVIDGRGRDRKRSKNVNTVLLCPPMLIIDSTAQVCFSCCPVSRPTRRWTLGPSRSTSPRKRLARGKTSSWNKRATCFPVLFFRSHFSLSLNVVNVASDFVPPLKLDVYVQCLYFFYHILLLLFFAPTSFTFTFCEG